MVEQDVSERFRIAEQGGDGVFPQRGKGFIGRCENGERRGLICQRANQIRSLKRGHQRREVRVRQRNVDNTSLRFGDCDGGQHRVNHVDDAVGCLDIGLDHHRLVEVKRVTT